MSTTSTLAQKPATDWAAVAKKTALWTVLLTVVWPTQYLFVAPCVALLRFVGALFKMVGIAAVLVFIPFLGWIALYFIWQGRVNERNAVRRHREMMAALAPQTALIASEPKSIWSPWLVSLVTN